MSKPINMEMSTFLLTNPFKYVIISYNSWSYLFVLSRLFQIKLEMRIIVLHSQLTTIHPYYRKLGSIRLTSTHYCKYYLKMMLAIKI